MNILITGSGGLIGSEAVDFFCKNQNNKVFGIDNNSRELFFGSHGSVIDRLQELSGYNNFHNYFIDIRNFYDVFDLFKKNKFDVVIHTAAQPSHDLAATIPHLDFETNAVGTLNLLESVRNTNEKCVFILLSTNKVYGDKPNFLKLFESDKRYDFLDPEYQNGIDENFTIDQSMHSLFGVSKLSADILVQEYGRYFNIPSCVLRGGCLTGENHKGVELHGFLNYFVKSNLNRKKYTIFGYKGKQVRDNIHALDVIRFINLFIHNPKYGEVYNIGGGKNNSCSILELSEIVQSKTSKPMLFEYSDTNRIGDHICYYTNLNKIYKHFPEYKITLSLSEIVDRIIDKS